MDDFSVRKNIPISILKRRANAMRGQADKDIIDLSDAPEPPQPPSPTLLNQLRKLMETNKDDIDFAPPPPIISQKAHEESQSANVPPPPSLSQNNTKYPIPTSQGQHHPPVINIEPEDQNTNYPNSAPMPHPQYMGAPHMSALPHHYPPSQMGGPAYNPAYNMGFSSHPSNMGHHQSLIGMGGPPPGFYQQAPPAGYHPQQMAHLSPGVLPSQFAMPQQSETAQIRPPSGIQADVLVQAPRNGNAVTNPPKHAASLAEKEDSLRDLLTQREVYMSKAKALTKDLERLKQHKSELLSSKQKSAQTSAFVQENEKLQEEIKSKIKGIDNIVEMLGKIILETETKLKKRGVSTPLLLGKKRPLGSSTSSSSSSSSSESSSSSSSSEDGRKKRKKKRRKTSSSSDSSTRRRKKRKDREMNSKEILIHEELLRMEMERKKPKDKEEPIKRDDSRRSRSIDFKEKSRYSHEDRRSRDRETDWREDRKHSSQDRELSELKRERIVKGDDTRTKGEVLERPTVDERQLNMISYDPRTSRDERRSREPYEEKVNYNFYDPEIHWCSDCNVFPTTVKAYLLHLLDQSHTVKLAEKNAEDRPWHEMPAEATPPVYDDPSVMSKPVPIRGVQMFVPVTGWYCKLCETWIGDLHCASVHLKSIMHAKRYNTFTEEHPHWEIEWLSDRTRAYERSLKTAAAMPLLTVCASPSKDKKSSGDTTSGLIPLKIKTEPQDDSKETKCPTNEKDLTHDSELFDEWQKTSLRETELSEVISSLKGKVMEKIRQSAKLSLKESSVQSSPDSDIDKRREGRDRGNDRFERERGNDRGRPNERFYRDRDYERNNRDREDSEKNERDKDNESYNRDRDNERYNRDNRKSERDRQNSRNERDSRDRHYRNGHRSLEKDSASQAEQNKNEPHREREVRQERVVEKSCIRHSKSRCDSSPSPSPSPPPPSKEGKGDSSTKLWKPSMKDRLEIPLDQVHQAKIHAEGLLGERGVGKEKNIKQVVKAQIGRMPFLQNRKPPVFHQPSSITDIAKMARKTNIVPPPIEMDKATTSICKVLSTPEGGSVSDAANIPLPPSVNNAYGPIMPAGRSGLILKTPGAPSTGPKPPPSRSQLEKLKNDLNKKLNEVQKQDSKISTSPGLSSGSTPVRAPMMVPPPKEQPTGVPRNAPPRFPAKVSRFDKTTGNYHETQTRPSSILEPPTPRQDDSEEDDLAMLGITSDDFAAGNF